MCGLEYDWVENEVLRALRLSCSSQLLEGRKKYRIAGAKIAVQLDFLFRFSGLNLVQR